MNTNGLTLEAIRPWSSHPDAAPRTERHEDALVIGANGTRTCVGGWQLDYSGAAAGVGYRIRTTVTATGIDEWRDRLQCVAYWGGIEPDRSSRRDGDVVCWDYLIPEVSSEGALGFSRTFVAPDGTDRLSVRFTLRWTTLGSSQWSLPEIDIVEAAAARDPVPIAVVTGRQEGLQGDRSIAGNVDHYAGLCEAACATGAKLIVTPEIAVQNGVEGSPIDLAVPVAGPETDRFADLARRHGVRVLLGLHERDGDAVYNTALLIGPTGEIDGRYRKVHLAVADEMDSGILPGEDFPVFATELGRIGCNICMDSSAAESSRMIGLHGADLLLLPIMGDFRAWHPEDHTFDRERFLAIMRTRAMDNQMAVIVAVNRGEGSCIIDRVGHVLAYNDGSVDAIHATIDLDDGFRPSSKGCYRGVSWMQRRPHVYGAFVDRDNVGSLT